MVDDGDCHGGGILCPQVSFRIEVRMDNENGTEMSLVLHFLFLRLLHCVIECERYYDCNAFEFRFGTCSLGNFISRSNVTKQGSMEVWIVGQQPVDEGKLV